MQQKKQTRREMGSVMILCIIPVCTAALLILVPSIEEPLKIVFLGIALLAVGLLGKKQISRHENSGEVIVERRVRFPQTSNGHRRVVVIGGGPAGLTAGYKLTEHRVPAIVVEKALIVGGLARTENYKGYRFDVGGHRFFTKSRLVQQMWEDVLGSDFLYRRRLSRIYYRQKFFDYPLRPVGALHGLGLVNGLRIVLSYLGAQLFPHRREETFEQWVSNRFGKRLFEIFFKSYTEKVWGISCSELRAEWAAQRIKTLTLWSTMTSMFWKSRATITTLIEHFHYPRLGPGMMWNAVKNRIEEAGGEVLTESEVVCINRTGRSIDSVVIRQGEETKVIEGSDFISSMPLTELIARLDPPPPAEVVRAASTLRYRDFITVCLIVNKKDLFSDNWIYVHDPDIKVSRIQNFKNWSPEMVPDPATSSLGLEYFCTEGDELWRTCDADLIELGKREAEQMGLLVNEDVLDGCVFRVPKSYPIYDSSFREQLATVRSFVDQLENLHTIGRNGLHRYDNQDHAMLTGMWAVRNILFGEANDVWQVNTEQEYHEQIRTEGYQEDPVALDDYDHDELEPRSSNGAAHPATSNGWRTGVLE